MENQKSITGIVVGKVTDSKYYIWCSETYSGSDGCLETNPANPVGIGSWVAIYFTNQDYQRYFPSEKSPYTPRFEATNYTVIPEIYETEVVDTSDHQNRVPKKTVRIKFPQWLSEDQLLIDHHFFGIIENNQKRKFPAGDWKLSIKRYVDPKNMQQYAYKSVWVLEKVEFIQEDRVVPIIGIVAGIQFSNVFVWCKEGPVGKDAVIEMTSNSKELALGTWITFTVSKYDFDKFFATKISTVARYAIQNYNVIEPIHETTLTGPHFTTISLNLECWIPEGSGDIWHPFVGLIINDKQIQFIQSGTYSILIKRAIPKERPPRSVWFLHDASLKSADPSTHGPGSLMRHLSSLSINSTRSEIPGNNEPSSSTPQPSPRRFSRLDQQSKKLGTHSEQNLTHSIRTSPTRRSKSRPARSKSRARFDTVSKDGLVYNINRNGDGKEDIYVWLLDEHIDSLMTLTVPAEKLTLKPGSKITAQFYKKKERWYSSDDDLKIDNSYFTFREAGSSSIDVSACAENVYGGIDGQPNYIIHDYFGKILDINNKVRNLTMAKKHMWIRRIRLGDDRIWIVIEQDRV